MKINDKIKRLAVIFLKFGLLFGFFYLIVVPAIVLFAAPYVAFHNVNFFEIKNIGLERIPCKNPTTISLGSPYVGGNVAEFTTNGSAIYVKSQKFDHTGILTPKQYVDTIYIGKIDELPTWDPQKGKVSNLAQETTFSEGNYGQFKVDSGRYWLWAGGGDVILLGCDPNGVSDPKPAQ